MTLVDEDAEQRTEARHAWFYELLTDQDPPQTLEELLVRPAYQQRAACRGVGPEISREGLLAGIWAGISARGRRQLGRAAT